MKLIAKQLSLFALALLVSSTQLRAEELPFKVGDEIYVRNLQISLTIVEIKGKWVKSDQAWYNSDLWLCIDHKTK